MHTVALPKRCSPYSISFKSAARRFSCSWLSSLSHRNLQPSSPQVRRDAFRERQVVQRMCPLARSGLSLLVQAYQSILAHRFQHDQSWLLTLLADLLQQTIIEQRGTPLNASLVEPPHCDRSPRLLRRSSRQRRQQGAGRAMLSR